MNPELTPFVFLVVEVFSSSIKGTIKHIKKIQNNILIFLCI